MRNQPRKQVLIKALNIQVHNTSIQRFKLLETPTQGGGPAAPIELAEIFRFVLKWVFGKSVSQADSRTRLNA